MAEETDSTQKPKAELIKHTQADPGGEKTPLVSPAKSGERHKIILKKKTSAAGGAPSAAKKPKLVVHSSHQDAKADSAGSRGGENQDGVSKADIKDTSEASGLSPGNLPGSFSFAQRPAVVAGRVGGRPASRKPHHDAAGPSSPPPNRPSPAGRVGSRQGQSGFSGAPRPGGGRFGHGPGHDGGRTGGHTGGFGSGHAASPHGGPRPGGAGRPGFAPRPGMGRGGPGSPPPGPIPEGKTAKRTFKAKKPSYSRKEKELEMEEKLLQTKKKITYVANPVPKSIEIMEVISVSELAKKMNLKASDLIQKLMRMGMMVTINQQIDADTATILAGEFGADVKIISLYDETVIDTGTDEGAEMVPRPPVVTVMGHVDHGKTKLLDAIRSADVVAGEFGGITQHIGAYMVDTAHGSITFLDTPGHEAFTRMRARGAQVTDIVVLVVAADDGVMPQTIEAINHAKEAEVPIIVAVNKIDKPEANPDRVKSQLSDIGLMPEEWGGQTMFVELSALQKTGIDKLIESILLEAELLDLKANFRRSAEGKILESRIDHGRGIVATVMVEKGTIAIGDSFVAGIWPGKVRAIFNDKGEKLNHATPSMPVEVLGFEGIPNAGDPLQVVADEKVAREYSSKRQELKRFEDAKNFRKVTVDNLHDMISDGTIQELKVIIKADVQGSAEALKSSLEKLSTKEVRLHVIQALPGPINEGDVDLAIASKAIIIGFNVRPLPKAKVLAEQEKIDIRKYNVIYKAVEEIHQAMEGMLKPDTKEEIIATVEVRNTFKVPKVGTIAGCYVQTGTVKRSGSVNVIRAEIVIHSGKIASLRRFKDDARDVAAGYECGIGLEGFDDIQVGDQFEVIEVVEVARKLSMPDNSPAS
ncbi:MAG: translation initiation factor IF-2 [Treponema sp.]|jgi:translation initiation factor IF-2|nr:translation initiation factor IF-2 [Treponema sp.]